MALIWECLCPTALLIPPRNMQVCNYEVWNNNRFLRNPLLTKGQRGRCRILRSIGNLKKNAQCSVGVNGHTHNHLRRTKYTYCMMFQRCFTDLLCQDTNVACYLSVCVCDQIINTPTNFCMNYCSCSKRYSVGDDKMPDIFWQMIYNGEAYTNRIHTRLGDFNLKKRVRRKYVKLSF